MEGNKNKRIDEKKIKEINMIKNSVNYFREFKPLNFIPLEKQFEMLDKEKKDKNIKFLTLSEKKYNNIK